VSLLSVDHLKKAFGGVRAVDGISFALDAGETVALIGPNGAGKTTCFNMLTGQIHPDAGTIRFNGIDISRLPPAAMWRLGIARTFQIPAVFLALSARENVQTALISRHRMSWGLTRRAASLFADEAERLLDDVGMAGAAEQVVADLAYADRKRLEVAIALVNEPKLLVMDEPMAGVAAGERETLMALIGAIVRARGIGVLFTEHDMEVVFGHASRLIVLHQGQVIGEGSPEAVRKDPLIRKVYLGAGPGGVGRPEPRPC
jgi:branched-chain amino acid transport system ATP-binding protein